jgi:hypothetical protein
MDCSFLCICVYLIGLSCSSAKHAHRGYMLLIQHVAGFEGKLLALEVAELSLYFKEVSKFPCISHSQVILFLLIIQAVERCIGCSWQRCCKPKICCCHLDCSPV